MKCCFSKSPRLMLLSIQVFVKFLTGNCSKCQQGRLHLPCESKCSQILFCGHTCQDACIRACPPCSDSCKNYCDHRMCKRKCGDPCQPCENTYTWECPHQKWTEPCGKQWADRPSCDEPCKKKLPCDHMCIGVCGEECPKLCRVCDEAADEFRESNPGAMFVELVDCGHVFEVKTLDQWMEESNNTRGGSEEDEIKYKLCPKCSTPILSSRRYGKIVKKVLADFEAVKRRICLLDVADSKQIHKILVEVQEIKEFKKEVEEITQSITTDGSVSSEEVTKRQNQVTLLKVLDSIHSLVKKNRMDQDLFDKVDFLKSRVMKRRECFSEQEIKEFIEELPRTNLLVCFKGLMTFLEYRAATLCPGDTSSVNSIRAALESGEVIGKYNKLMQTDNALLKKIIKL